MLQKALAALLVLSWIGLAGFDVLEDLRSPIHVEVHSAADAPLQAMGQGLQLANNIVESADHSRLRHSALFERPAVHSAVEAPAVASKGFRLHKFHRVFLI